MPTVRAHGGCDLCGVVSCVLSSPLCGHLSLGVCFGYVCARVCGGYGGYGGYCGMGRCFLIMFGRRPF